KADNVYKQGPGTLVISGINSFTTNSNLNPVDGTVNLTGIWEHSVASGTTGSVSIIGPATLNVPAGASDWLKGVSGFPIDNINAVANINASAPNTSGPISLTNGTVNANAVNCFGTAATITV